MHVSYLHYLFGEDTALNHVRQFSAAARNLGHIVDVHAMNLGNPATGDRNSWSRRIRPRFRDLARGYFGRYLHEPKELLWNLKYIRKETKLVGSAQTEVLLVRDHRLTASCVSVARRLNLPLVLELNGPADEGRLYTKSYMGLPWVPKRLERYKLQHADAVTVVSTALKDYLVELHDLASNKIHVVPNGADTARFHPSLEGNRDEVGIPDDAVVVGFVGSFQPWHGTEMLGRAVAEAGTAHSALHFLFVGEGPELAPVRERTKVLGDRARFIGRVAHEDVPRYVACFDIGLVADAGFYMSPLKVLEWMAAGKAIVAPRTGPMEEIISDRIEGLLFEPGDEASMVALLHELARDRELRARLGSAAAARVRESLTWGHNARRVLDACRQAKADHQARSVV